MKDSLEELLKQVYGQKEVPSQEFSQTVLQKMKEKDRKSLFWKIEMVYHKGALAIAICAGMLVLVGFSVIYWQGELRNMETPFQKDIAGREDATPITTEDPIGGKDRVETKNVADGKNQEEDLTDAENPVESENATDWENEVETDRMSGEEQKHRKDPGHSFVGKRSSDLGVSANNVTAKPGVQRKKIEPSGSDADTDSENREPWTMETALPMITGRPISPSETISPQNTPEPTKNYISLCSIETYSFSMGTDISTSEEVVFPDNIFSDRLILSYEQLQILIQELENSLPGKPDDGLQELFMQLKGYDQEYFVSNALCYNMFFLQGGLDLRLRGVWIGDMGKGKHYLDIWLDKVYDETVPSSAMQYYSSLVSVPQNIAKQCDMVTFQCFDEME